MMSSSSNQQSVDRLYRQHHGWLHGWLRKRLGCSETAADLAQDTFVKLLVKPRHIDNSACARGYLRTVAGRICIDFWRRKSIEKAWLDSLAQQPELSTLSAQEQTIIVETLQQIDNMLGRLPEKVARAFTLSQIDGQPYRQIALELGVSERTIKSYMAQAMYQCMLIEAQHDAAVSGG